MSRILSVASSNYKIQVANGGSITLDTQGNSGSGYGTVYVKGNLDVVGALTYIETTNTQVTDNILQLNYGQSGSAVTGSSGFLGQSGIEIMRGSSSSAQLVFNENITHWDENTNTSVTGTFQFKTANGILSGVALQTITNAGGSTDIVFDLQSTNKVLTIANASNYASNVSANGDIPNLAYLKQYVGAGALVPGVADVSLIYAYPSNPTAVRTYSSSNSNTVNSGEPVSPADPTATNYTSQIVMLVDNVIKVQINPNGLYTGNLKINSNTISNYVSGNNLILATKSGSNVEIDNPILLLNQASAPTYTSTGTELYSNAVPGPGKTGLFFVNSLNYNDELVAKNRALLLSMIF